MDSKLVSVIITTFSGSCVLERAINSVKNQTYKNIEIVVVDDNDSASEERKKTEAIMAHYQNDVSIKYIRHSTNKNGSAARNTGIKNSQGEYLSFLDDDDIYMPNRIEMCVKTLENNTDCDSVVTGVLVTNGTQVIDVIEQTFHQDPLRDMFFGNSLGTGSNLFLRRPAVEYLNGFDETFLRRQDIEFMVRFYKKFKSAYINENLVVKVVQPRQKIKIDYKKFVAIEKKFINTFEDVIFSYLNEKDRYDYLNHTFNVLFRMALVSSKTDTKLAVQDLLQIRKLTIKERILAKFNVLYRVCRYNKFLYYFKQKFESVKFRNHVKNYCKFSESEINFLKSKNVIK